MSRPVTPQEGDAICSGVLELLRRLAGQVGALPFAPERTPVERYDPVPTTPESRWLDCLDSETRAGWPSR